MGMGTTYLDPVRLPDWQQEGEHGALRELVVFDGIEYRVSARDRRGTGRRIRRTGLGTAHSMNIIPPRCWA